MVSKAFQVVFMAVSMGSPRITCWCGRTHYTTTGQFMDESELDELTAMTEKMPAEFIPTDDHSVRAFDLLGRTYVEDCPCDYAASLERKLWENREQIIWYYQERIVLLKREVHNLDAALTPITSRDTRHE